MYPVLFSINKISISSFGVFLALGLIFGVFLIWRLSRAWELNEEKVLDLTLLAFLGGLLGSRVYFVIEKLQYFIQNPQYILLFNKVPGFSFWGAFIGGWLTLYYFTRKKKIDFWQAGDIAVIGLLGGLIFSSLGCFLGGCNIGVQSNWFFATSVAGSLGKRFPVQILEAILFLLAFLNLWGKSTRFHNQGKILSLGLIYIGLIKFFTEPLRAAYDEGLFLSFILIVLGINILYRATNRKLTSDLKEFFVFVRKLFTDSLTRKQTLAKLRKSWYNRRASFSWNVRSLKKKLGRINVNVSYKNNKLH